MLQHHCRACGQVFCHKCSSKSCPLPKFGIEREVRVCDTCFDQYGPKDESPRPHQPAKKEADLPAEYLASALSQQVRFCSNTMSYCFWYLYLFLFSLISQI